MLETRQLQYFLAVAKAGNFSRAAEELRIAQPPLSRQIKLLEKRLNAELFERTPQGAILTPAGKFLAERTPAVLNELQELEDDVRAIAGGVSGVLRIGFVGTASYGIMPKLVARIRHELPEVEVRVSGEKLTPELERLLLGRKLDAAVLRPPVTSQQLELEDFGVDEFTLVVSPVHPLAGSAGPVNFTELKDHDYIAFQEGSAAETIIREAARDAGFELRIVQHVPETATVLALVAAGVGIALLPKGSVPKATEVLRTMEVTGGPQIGLSLAWLRGHQSPILRRIRPILEELAAQSRSGRERKR